MIRAIRCIATYNSKRNTFQIHHIAVSANVTFRLDQTWTRTRLEPRIFSYSTCTLIVKCGYGHISGYLDTPCFAILPPRQHPTFPRPRGAACSLCLLSYPRWQRRQPIGPEESGKTGSLAPDGRLPVDGVRTTPNSLFWRTPSSLLLAIADQRVVSALGLVACPFPRVASRQGLCALFQLAGPLSAILTPRAYLNFVFRSDDGDPASNSAGGRRRHSAPANPSTSAATAQLRDSVGAVAGFKTIKSAPARGSANGGKAEQQQRSPPTAAQPPLPAAVALISARSGDETQGQGQFGPGLAVHHHGSQGDLGAGAPGSGAAGGGGSDLSKSSSMPRMQQQRAEAGHFLEGEVKRTEMGRVISRGGVATLSGSGPQAPHSGGGRAYTRSLLSSDYRPALVHFSAHAEPVCHLKPGDHTACCPSKGAYVEPKSGRV